MKKMIIVFLIFVFIPIVRATDLSFAANAKSAFLMEASTGKILYEKMLMKN